MGSIAGGITYGLFYCLLVGGHNGNPGQCEDHPPGQEYLVAWFDTPEKCEKALREQQRPGRDYFCNLRIDPTRPAKNSN